MTATEALERRIDELCSEVERLRKENAKLRGFWTHDGTWHVELPRLPEGIAVTMPDGRDREVRTVRAWRYVREDEAENDRLRELVRTMAYCMQYERDCDECRMNGADGNIAEPCGCDGLLDRLRELGIEVGA